MKHTDEIHTKLPYWLTTTVILGEDDGEGESAGGSGDESGSDGIDEVDEGNTDGLRSALQKERQGHRDETKRAKALEAELARYRQAEEERAAAEQTELEKLQAQVEKLQESNSRLAEGYLRDAIDAAIRKAAETAKFADVDDAVALINRANITFEQSAEDPSEVTIDVSTVDKEVKDLATRKPHYLKTGTGDGEPTGGQFGGGGGQKKKVDEEALKEKYPSLR